MYSSSAERSKGAALVELALALPILIMLIVGMVTAGSAYNHQLALTHSAREAGRHAATLPVTNFGSMNAWLDDVAARSVTDATGSLNPGTAGLSICVAFVHPDGALALDQTRSRMNNAGTITYASAPCFADGRPNNERRVQIAVARDAPFSVVFFSSTLRIDSEAVNKFEAAGGL